MWTKAAERMFALLGLLASHTLVTASTPFSPAASIECMSYATSPASVTTTPPLVRPQDIDVDGDGNIFVVDSARADMIRIDAVSHESDVLIGRPYLEIPIGLALSPTHADLYIGDENTSTVWVLMCQTRSSSSCTQYHQKPLNLTLSSQVHPVGLQIDAEDHLFIADFNGHTVWRRDSNTGKLKALISMNTIPDNEKPSSPFGPHDIALDPETHMLLITDVTNDDIWAIACAKVAANGAACDVYSNAPFKFPLTGTDIRKPSGIVTDMQSTIFVSGMQNGVVAQVQNNHSTDLLATNSGSSLKDPVSLAYDRRATGKVLYIADDPTSSSDDSQGLWKLPCTQLACVKLESNFFPGVLDGECANTPVGQTCQFKCRQGYMSNATEIACTSEGWALGGVVCVSAGGGGGGGGPGSHTSAAPPADGGDGVGVAVGVTLTLLVLAFGGVFLFIRSRKAKQAALSSEYTPFGAVKVSLN